MEDDILKQHWHLDKKVPLGLILTILVQSVYLAWFLSSMNAALIALDKRATALEVNRQVQQLSIDATTVTVAVQNQRFDQIKDALQRIENDIKELKREQQ